MTHPQPQGFLAVPSAGKGPGVLVLHAWWGLNDAKKAVCARLAEAVADFVATGGALKTTPPSLH
jgi:dienelactone hydrolase